MRAAGQEICSRREERHQLAVKKEQLEEVFLGIRAREAEWEKQFHCLQEKTQLLEEELARTKRSKERLEDQRRKSILELVKAQGEADEANLQAQEIIRDLKRDIKS
ncbi:hypothetical protein CR513_12757, partial [Mucuna pruriens]